jgi:hypothetical protein
MRRPRSLPAFTEQEYETAQVLLATRVAYMMGRKLEEGDWAEVYCRAKGIPLQGWSNLNIDVMHDALGIEHKMICYRSHVDLLEACGRSLMHPSATRSIRVPSPDTDPEVAKRDILQQYADLIEMRREKVREAAGGREPDVRTGWLLWQQSLRQFLYFEEEMLPPNPDDYTASWRRSGGGIRKESRNLWVYERETGKKRYSITTAAGAKIQPYFDVPPASDPNLYHFRVIGEVIEAGLVRVWVTEATERELRRLLGELDTERLSAAIVEAAAAVSRMDVVEQARTETAHALIVTETAYLALHEALPGVSDEHSFQLLAQHLRQRETRWTTFRAGTSK